MTSQPTPPPRLDHENLDVYQCALQFARTTNALLAIVPRTEPELREQWKRAAISVALNIAEGAGKPGIADRARFYAIARGSAMECGAILDLAALAEFITVEQAHDAKVLLVRIVSMLTKLCR